MQSGARATKIAAQRSDLGYLSDMELGHWVTGSMGHLGHLSRPGHRVTGSPGYHFDPVCDPSFSGFRKKPKIKI